MRRRDENRGAVRDPGVLSQHATQLQPAHIGQHRIDEDDVGLGSVSARERVAPVQGLEQGEPAWREDLLEPADGAIPITGDEYERRAGGSSCLGHATPLVELLGPQTVSCRNEAKSGPRAPPIPWPRRCRAAATLEGGQVLRRNSDQRLTACAVDL